jgi:hypothetical protein
MSNYQEDLRMIIDTQPVNLAPHDASLVILSQDDDGGCVAAVRYFDTGEVREQYVDRVNFHAKWFQTVAKRAAKLDRNDLTPHNLLPRS